MEIRPAARHDAYELAELIQPWRPDTAYAMRTRAAYNWHPHQVAVNAGCIIGWLQGNHDSEAWRNMEGHEQPPVGGKCSYITQIYTDPTNRRQGVGRALLDSFEAGARTAGNSLVVLLHDFGNADVLEDFYTGAGYKLRADHHGRSGQLFANDLTAI